MLYRKLAYGGKIVIFPWAMQGDYETTKAGSKALAEIVSNFGGEVDEQFDFKGINRKTLLKYMSVADREISSTMSKVFNSSESYFTALVISKSKKSSLDALRSASFIGRAATTEQIQD
jgi:hypothetical protein